MRVYFEKPRTTVGWKGLINDPGLDGSFDIDRGLRIARRLLRDIADLGVPAGCEFLDTTTPQYIADLVAWAAIGARTTESQVHREMASGLSCPVGFKNGTDGNITVPRRRLYRRRGRITSWPLPRVAARRSRRPAVIRIAISFCAAGKRRTMMPEVWRPRAAIVARVGVNPAIMIDASHANSGKQPENQPLVVEAVSAQIEAGEQRIIGLMVESNLLGGRQDLIAGTPLIYGRSITDACLDWKKRLASLSAWRVRLKGDDGGSHWLQGMPRRPWVQARIGALAQLRRARCNEAITSRWRGIPCWRGRTSARDGTDASKSLRPPRSQRPFPPSQVGSAAREPRSRLLFRNLRGARPCLHLQVLCFARCRALYIRNPPSKRFWILALCLRAGRTGRGAGEQRAGNGGKHRSHGKHFWPPGIRCDVGSA